MEFSKACALVWLRSTPSVRCTPSRRWGKVVLVLPATLLWAGLCVVLVFTVAGDLETKEQKILIARSRHGRVSPRLQRLPRGEAHVPLCVGHHEFVRAPGFRERQMKSAASPFWMAGGRFIRFL